MERVNWQTRQRILVLMLLVGGGILRVAMAYDPIGEPLQRLVSPLTRWTDRLAFSYEPAQVTPLSESARVQQLAADNQRLRSALGFVQDLNLKVVGADIIQKDIASFQKFITINRGRSDGVTPGLAVISEDVLVGVVARASNRRATVRLVSDPGFRVTATASGSRLIE